MLVLFGRQQAEDMSANATAFLPAEFAERLFNQMRGRLPIKLTKYV
jgi:hypothetical protein